MQNLITKVKSWLTIPRNRRQFIIGAIGVFVLIGVVAFSPQISNLLSLFGSEAFVPTDINWKSGASIVSGGGDSQSIVVSTDNGDWLYSIGGLDIDNNRKNSVYRMKLDDNGLPTTWEGFAQGVPQMKFKRAGHKLIEHGGFIYAITGDIHISEATGIGEYPLAYSTIERLDVNRPNAVWDIVTRVTGVHFFPEVFLDGDNLHIIGGVYGSIPNMGGFEEVSNPSIFNNRPVLGGGHFGVPLTVSKSLDPLNLAGTLSQSIVGDGSAGASSYGKFYTTVSEHYQMNLTNPFDSNNFIVGELGLDGGDITEDGELGLKHWNDSSERKNNAEMKMGHLRFKFQSFGDPNYPSYKAYPLPQGRFGHKIFKSDDSIYVTGGASWSAPIVFSYYSPGFGSQPATSSNTTIYPFWVISDKLFPKNYTFNSEEGTLGYWKNDFVGNTTYQWDEVGLIWRGTGPEVNNGTWDDKYALEVNVTQGLDNPPIISGLAFIGLDSFGDASHLAVGGIRNKKNQLTGQIYSDSSGNNWTSSFFMELAEVNNTFIFTGSSGWSPSAPYSNSQFGVNVIGLGAKAISFGGQNEFSDPYSYPYGSSGRDVEGWPVGTINDSTTRVFNGTSWSLAGSHSNWVGNVAVAYINNGSEAVIYRVGGEISSYPYALSTKMQYTGPLAIYDIPDENNSGFYVLPTGTSNPQLGDDGYAFTASVFELIDSDGDPMSGIFVGISADKNEIQVCATETWWEDGCSNLDSYVNEDGDTVFYSSTVTTDSDGIAVLYIKSKNEMTDGEYNTDPKHIQSATNLTGYYIIPGSGSSSSNPTGILTPTTTLELTGYNLPFNANTDICIIEGTSCTTSRQISILADGTAKATIEVGLVDGVPSARSGPRKVDGNNYDIRLTSKRAEDQIASAGYSNNKNARFEISSILPGETELMAWYKPKFTNALLERYLPWIPIFIQNDDSAKKLTINFTGNAGILTPDNAKQGDNLVSITATGNATRWTQGTTTVQFINPPEITLSRIGGLDELGEEALHTFNINVSNYPNQTVELSVVEGGGSLTQPSVETNSSGNASFTYRTGTVDGIGIEKIQASIANGQITKEMWLTVGESTPLYSLEYELSGDITSTNPYTVVRARLINSTTGKPATGTDPSFEFTNNDNGILFETNYNSETGIAKAIYKASSDGFDGEIFIDASYISVSVFDRILITNLFGGSGVGINTSNLVITNDEELSFDANVVDNAKVGFWILRITTNIGGQNETYDYAFEVTPKITSDGGILSSISPSITHRGTNNLIVDITGLNTTFDAVADPVVRFISDSNDSSGIEILNIDPRSPTNLRVTLNISSSAVIGYWDVEVDLGAGIKYIMPGDFDFLIMPDDASGYYINLDIGSFGASWEPGTLPANGTATIDLTASVNKFNIWLDTKTQISATFTSSLTPQKGTLTPPTSPDAFVYSADETKGEVEALFRTTITDASLPEGTLDLEVAITITKLANQVTLDIIVPIQGNRYNYQTSEEIRVVVVRTGSTTPVIDDKFKIDADDKIVDLPVIYVSSGLEYNIWVDPPNHLAVGASFTATNDTETTITPVLTSEDGIELAHIGDINLGTRDNAVNSFDFQIFTGQFMRDIANSLADFNSDGAVNVMDWPYLLTSWMAEGAIKPF